MSKPIVSVSSRLEFDKVQFDEPGKNHLLISLEGGKIDRPKDRKPLRIGAAVDCSGSMRDGGKIENAKQSLKIFIDNLTPDDAFGLVGFSDSVFSVFEPMFMTPENKEKAKVEVDKLNTINMTNLSGATLEAYNMVKGKLPKPEKKEAKKAEFGKVGGVKIIDDANDTTEFLARGFLFTDGLPTAGEMDKSKLIELAGKRPSGASLSCFGYGSDHDAELMASMAKRGGGNFYFIKNIDECPAFFGREFGGLISCVAQGIKVELTAAAGVKFTKVYNDFDVNANDEETECTISVDDIYAEETRKLLVMVELPEKSKAVAARSSKLCDVEVTYTDLKTGEEVKLEESVKIDYVKKEEAQDKGDKLVLEQILRFKAADAQAEARKLADKGQYVQASSLMCSIVQDFAAIGTEGAMAMSADIQKNVIPTLNDQAYDSNYLVSNTRSYTGGRGMTAGSAHAFDRGVVAKSALSFQAQADAQGAYSPSSQVPPQIPQPAPSAPWGVALPQVPPVSNVPWTSSMPDPVQNVKKQALKKKRNRA
jgi:hypothetical protein